MLGVAEGTEDPKFIHHMMVAEYRSTHSEDDLDNAPISVLRMNLHYSMARERRLAKLIAIELGNLFGGAEGG